MGRWAQRNKRGGGGYPQPTGFPVPAPGVADWTLTPVPEFGQCDLVDPGSAPTAVWNIQWGIHGDPPTLGELDLVTAPILGATGHESGEVFDFQCAYFDQDTGLQQSDWSDIKQITLP